MYMTAMYVCIYLSICLSICLSIYLSRYMFSFMYMLNRLLVCALVGWVFSQLASFFSLSVRYLASSLAYSKTHAEAYIYLDIYV